MKPSRGMFLPLAFSSVLLICSCLSALAQEMIVPPRVTEAVDVNKLVTLRGNTHPLARPEFDRGAAPDSQPMRRMLLVLQRSPEQEAELRQLLDEQQVKSSPNFHRWLTPEEFGQRFGPAEADIQAVTDWLISQGFEVGKVAAGHTVIEFSGTAGQVRQAFHTEIHKYAVNDEERAEAWANASDPQIPAALAPVVTGFASLNNFPRQRGRPVMNAFSRSQATGEVRPLFTVSGNGTNYYAVAPLDFATIYNVLPLWNSGIDGTGQTIAIVADTNIHISDVRDFRNTFGLPSNDPQIILDGPDPGVSYDEGEAILDIEWSGAMAKKSAINLVVSEGTETTWGIDLSSLYVIDNNLAPIMSVSYGECEEMLGVGGNAFYSATREQGAAQGITIINSTGDAGSARCDQIGSEVAAEHGLAVSGLAATPFNVAVGGTDFGDVNNWAQYWKSTNSTPGYGSALSYIPETTWNSSCAASGLASSCASAGTDTPSGIDHLAGGGGPSTCGIWNVAGSSATCASGYPKPAWQSGAGVPKDGVRDIPDVSLYASIDTSSRSFYAVCMADALPAGYISCQPSAGNWYFTGAGGTSAAAPNFAGIMALVNQKTGQRQGNANYVLYPLAAQPGATCTSNAAAVSKSNCIFYDVVSGNNSVACVAGSTNCSAPSGGGYGILVSPADKTTPAWKAAAGYDLVTGLGSINAANLVNKWSSVTFTPSTTTLSLSTAPATSPITLTHGQPLNVSINVAPSSGTGTPTGDVSLIAQTSTSQSAGAGTFTLSGGTASGTTDLLPGGTYNVVAHYAGDGVFGASDSTGVQVTVKPESSLTKVGLVTFDPNTGQVVSSNASTVTYGSLYYLLRVNVSNVSGNPCASSEIPEFSCPTGEVTVTDNGAPLDAGTYPLNSQGYTEDQTLLTSSLAIGTHNLLATYAGDVSYAGSTSPTDTIAVIPAVTTTTISNFPSSVFAESYANLTITVQTQSNGVVPNCNDVQILNGSTVIPWGGDCGGTNGSVSSPASLVVSVAIFMSTAGSVTLTAQFIGDSNYAPSTSAPVTIKVTDFSISANPSSFTVTQGQTGASTLTITPLSGFTGNVTLNCINPPPGTTCTFSPASPSVTGSSAVTAVLTLTTSAHVLPVAPKQKFPPSFRVNIRLPLLLAGLLALAMLMSLSVARRRPTWLIWATGLVVIGIWAACGGGGGGGGGGPAPAPTVSLSVNSLTFGNQNVGTSAVQNVTLSNAGNALLSVSSIVLSGANAGDFSEYDPCGGNVPVGFNCMMSIYFAPTAGGTRTATLSINDNAADSPQTVRLTGSGLGPAVSFSPTSLTFAGQDLTLTSPPKNVTLSNTGNAVLNLFATYFTGNDPPDFAQTNTCGSTVAAGANCTFSVTFTPTASGTRTASLSLYDNIPGDVQSVSLTGTGVPYTPKGSYTFTVTASAVGASWPLSHSVQITVTVQ